MVAESKAATALVKKQKDTGVWGPTLLGLAPSTSGRAAKDLATIPQYRRLVQLGYPLSLRPFKLADRVLFRLLSRDDDPALLFEFQKLIGTDPGAEAWARWVLREAVAAALAEAGYVEDPRLRGAAHKVASAVSHFLRSPASEKPFVRVKGQTVLHPEAYPPSWYSVAMIAAMPNLQRERAGFTERLAHYLGQPAPKKPFVMLLGRKKIKPMHLLLGDPMGADAKGTVKDLPLALHFLELLARIGGVATSSGATKVLSRLYKECDDQGVWHPKNLRSQPKALSPIDYHYFPLAPDSKSMEGRQADVTFRLALIAKLLGMQLEYV